MVAICNNIEMNPLPYDCVGIILQYSDIQDTVNICLALSCTQDVRNLIERRLLPTYVFSKLVNDPKELLDRMRIHRCFLIGSRAQEYFNPGFCSNDSDWNFVCDTENSATDLNCSMKYAMQNMGVEWQSKDLDSNNPFGNMCYVSRGVMKRGRGKGYKISLIYSSFFKPNSFIDTLMSYSYSTVVMCMLGAEMAVHLYGETSRQRKQIIMTGPIRCCIQDTQERNNMVCKTMIACNTRSLSGTLLFTSEERSAYDIVGKRISMIYKEKFKSTPLRPIDGIADSLNDILYSDLVIRGVASEHVMSEMKAVIFSNWGVCTCKESKYYTVAQRAVSNGYKEIDMQNTLRTMFDNDTLVIPFHVYQQQNTISSVYSYSFAQVRWAQDHTHIRFIDEHDEDPMRESIDRLSTILSAREYCNDRR